jgi:hypothetical protein
MWVLLAGVLAGGILGLYGSYPGAIIVVLAMIGLVGGRLFLFLLVMGSKK